MINKGLISDLPVFDAADFLHDAEDIAAYLTLAINEGDDAELARALGVAARARGMTVVARDSGLSREALYKALRAGASPRFETVRRVCKALGVELQVRVDTGADVAAA